MCKPTYEGLKKLCNAKLDFSDHFVDSMSYCIMTPRPKEYKRWLLGCFVDSDIDRVVFNEPATIVFWNDGTKTVVKTSPNDKFDKEKGILWAYFLKHAEGSKTQLQKEIAKHCEKPI